MILEVRQTRAKGKGLFTSSPAQIGSPLIAFIGKLGTDRETNDVSMQLGEDLFLESTMLLDDHLNHSCRPNAAIYWRRIPVLCALRPIDQGEEVTYNYATSEYDAVGLAKDHSFQCSCGALECYGTFRGFKYLPKEEKIRLLPLVSPFIASKMDQEAIRRVYPIGMVPEQVLSSIAAPRAS